VQASTATSAPAGRLSRRLPLLLILLIALAWRLLLWSQPLHLPANDEVEYIAVARDLLAGRGWAFYESWRWLRAPLYPLFLAGSLWLAGGDLRLAALPNILLSLGVVLLVYRLARELAPEAGRRPGLIAAALAALLQTYATFGSLYMSETLFSLLFAGGLLALARWRRSRRGWWALAAGVLLGLACLTRSAALVFLPVAALWAAWLAWGAGETGAGGRASRAARALAPALLLALGAALTIAPWTLRNCRAYGACVLIETGFSYNLWAFYEPREELDAINSALEAIPNPVDRAAEASRRGLERLREDPAILLRKIPAEWVRLWGVKPIQDRFLLADYYGDPPPPVFLAALVLDDLLYLLILCAAAYGLALRLSHRDALAVLLLLWLGVFVAATMVTHAEGRYRHFLFTALIPLAGVALDALARRERPWRGWGAPAGVALALALLPLLVFYPWEWAAGGAARSAYRWWGDGRAAAGDVAGAGRAYEAALAARETPDGWVALGRLRRAAGDGAGAEAAFRRALGLEPYVGASANLGDLLRAEGRADEARAAFRGRYLPEGRMVDWSYRLLGAPPVAAVDVGGGLDYGYVAGVYPAEQQQGAGARWTDGAGRLRLAAVEGPALLTLRAAAPHPGRAEVPLRVCVGRRCEEAPLGPEWREVRVLLPAAGEIELRSATFRGGDGRDLGVLLDWARVEPAP
jgi:4-amino-4-deoxy-L-arabinose transferase-like glycosyltransferase